MVSTINMACLNAACNEARLIITLLSSKMLVVNRVNNKLYVPIEIRDSYATIKIIIWLQLVNIIIRNLIKKSILIYILCRYMILDCFIGNTYHHIALYLNIQSLF